MKKVFNLLVVLGLLGGGYYVYRSRSRAEEETGPRYERIKAEVRDLRVTVESTGEVAPRNRLDVKPPIAGRVEELLVDEGDEVERGEIIGRISSTERAALLDAARANSMEELVYWEELYMPTPLVSPLSGIVIARNFEPGQSISSQDAVMVIADNLIVIASLDETDIGQVEVGQKVIIRLEAYPDIPFRGEVEKIAYDAQLVSNVTMYEVDVQAGQLPAFARSGMTANLEFIVQEKRDVVAVPTAAVQEVSSRSEGALKSGSGASGEERSEMKARMRESGMTDAEIEQRMSERRQQGGTARPSSRSAQSSSGKNGAANVWVEAESGEAVQQKIRTGLSDGQYVEVLFGLDEGDVVLVEKMNFSSTSRSGGSSSPFAPTGRMGRGRH